MKKPSKAGDKMVTRLQILGTIHLVLKVRKEYSLLLPSGDMKVKRAILERIKAKNPNADISISTIGRFLKYLDTPYPLTYTKISIITQCFTDYTNFDDYINRDEIRNFDPDPELISKKKIESIWIKFNKDFIKDKKKDQTIPIPSIPESNNYFRAVIERLELELVKQKNEYSNDIKSYKLELEGFVSGLLNLYLHIREINVVYKSLDLLKPLLENIVELVDQEVDTGDLKKLLKEITKADVLVGSKEDPKVLSQIISILMYLPTSLYINYTQSPLFSSIRIPSDFDNDIGELSMDDFFVSLSYKEKDQQAEDVVSLMKKEQAIKYWAESNYSVDDKFSSAEYLSSQILNHHRRLLVHGNAGVGKSTYARWICHQWSSSSLQINSLPLYIELKNLDFSSSANSIIIYIKKNYLNEFPENLIRKTLNVFSLNFRYIFDGIDELETAEKNRFTDDLFELTDDPKNRSYLVLGRPYGFLHHRLTNYEAVILIDGFNNSSVFRYVTTLCDKIGKKDGSKLIDLLKNNLILKEYSHTPLILSYIIMIYNYQDEGVEILDGVNSTYALHKEVYDWIMLYNIRTKALDLPSKEELQLIFNFSANLILQKKFVFKNKGVVFDEKELLEKISALGFGTLTEEDRGLTHLFSFISVTIQEYFATESLLENITSSRLSYLTNDSFFWNVIKLLIGGLSFDHRDAEVSKTLARLNGQDGWYDLTSNKVLYYSMLAEANPRVINRILKKVKLSELLDLCENFYFDTDWYSIALNALRRIVAKLSPSNRLVYRNNIVDRTSALLEVDRLRNEGVRSTYFIMELGIHTFLVNDNVFIDKVIKVIAQLSKEQMALKKPISETLSDEAYAKLSTLETAVEKSIDTMMFTLVRILEHTDPDVLKNNEELLKKVYEETTPFLKQDFAYVTARSASKASLSAAMHESLEKMKGVKSDDLSGTVFSPVVINHCVSIFRFSFLHPMMEAKEILVINSGIDHYLTLIGDGAGGDFHRASIKSCSEMLIAGLEKCQNHNFVDYIYAVHRNTEIEEYVYLENRAFYFEEVKNLKEKIAANLTKDLIYKFSWLLQYTVHGINEFYVHIKTCESIVDRWFNKYKTEFSEQDYDELDEDIALPMQSILSCASYGYDRRLLLKIAIKYHESPYFRAIIIPTIIDHDFAVHGEDIWNYLISLTNKEGYELQLLDYFQNDGFFSQFSDLENIKTVLMYISKEALVNEEFQRDQGIFIFTVCSNALILLKRSKHVDKELITMTGKLLDLSCLKDLLSQEAYVESLQAAYLMGYILQAYYTKDIQAGIPIQIAKYKQDFPSDYQDLVKLVIELLTDRQSGTENIEEIAEILDPVLTNDCIDYYENLSQNNEQFDLEFFYNLAEFEEE